MALNLCTNPAFGGFVQTMFLGCSISNFSCSVGWNEQQSILTVLLAQDPCAPLDGIKLYYDENLNAANLNAPDPGFSFPTAGSPVYFRINNGADASKGGFEFAGLMQSYEQLNSFQGNPVYRVTVVDPRQILGGVNLIIEDYAGSVFDVPNIFNVFGFCEQFGNPAPLTEVFGADFGSPAGAFGGSLTNSRGMSANMVFPAVSVLTSSIPPIIGSYSPFGRILFRLPLANFGGFGLIDSAEYLIDLSSLPNPPSYFRFTGTSISLLDAITQLCDEAGCDYYIELLPTKIDDVIFNIIKINTVSRAIQPFLGEISNFINATPLVNESTQGLEMRNEVTSAFVVGDNLQQIYQAYNFGSIGNSNNDIISPYFGIDQITGNVIQSITDGNGYWQFTVSILALNLMLNTPLNGNFILITEYELLAALGGYDIWYTDAWFNNRSIFQLITQTVKGIFNAKGIAALFNLGFGPLNLKAADLININANAFVQNAKNDADLQQIFNFILTYAQEFYGSKFMVQLPYTAVKYDPESAQNNGFAQITTSDTPSDGGWTDFPFILDLPHPSPFTDFFTLDDNRVGCFAEFSGASGFSTWTMNPDDFGIVSGNIYLRSSTESQLVYSDFQNLISPRVVIDLSESISTQQLPQWVQDARAGIAAMPAIMGNGGNNANAQKAAQIVSSGVGGFAIGGYWPNKLVVPDAIAVPLKSNTLNYGPWFINGPPGITTSTIDNTINPWNFGSTTTMNQAGASLALNATANQMIIGEMGSINIPGYPVIPLGAELGAYYAGYFGGGTNLIENRSALAGNFSAASGSYQYLSNGNWQGLYGPNITSINVEVGTQGVVTNYQMRTFTPKFGLFSRNNQELLKERGVGLARLERKLRGQELIQSRLAAITKQQKTNSKKEKKKPAGVNNNTNSSHEVLVGAMLTWGSGTNATTRADVTLEEAKEVGKELLNNYANKAFMSLDALLRPISLYGDGGFPRFATPLSGNNVTNTAGAQPPIFLSSTQCYSLPVSGLLLNPLANKGQEIYGIGTGHDITILGRGNTAPSGDNSNLNLYTSFANTELIGNQDYNIDYRFFGLKGPLVIHSWGFDLDGKPIPNAADTSGNASSGIFTQTNLQDTFLPNWLGNSQTWPVAPIDLRYDRRRAVWVSPPADRMLLVTTLSGINPNGSGYCAVSSGSQIYDSDGNQLTLDGSLSAPRILLQEVYGKAISSGQKLLAYYEPALGNYWPISAPSNTSFIHGIVQQTIPQSGSGIVNVYTRNPSISGEQLAGQSIVAFDWLLKQGQVIVSGSHVYCYYDNNSNIYYVQPPCCSN